MELHEVTVACWVATLALKLSNKPQALTTVAEVEDGKMIYF